MTRIQTVRDIIAPEELSDIFLTTFEAANRQKEAEQGLPFGTMDRLKLVSFMADVPEPDRVLDAEGAFTDELIHFVEQVDLSLDWLMGRDVDWVLCSVKGGAA